MYPLSFQDGRNVREYRGLGSLDGNAPSFLGPHPSVMLLYHRLSGGKRNWTPSSSGANADRYRICYPQEW